VPDEAGQWRVTVEDGMGHKGTITVPAGQGSGEETPSAAANTGGTKTPLVFRITLGLSLILNVFAVYNFALKKRAVKKDAAYAH
jgi:hypothetical protein